MILQFNSNMSGLNDFFRKLYGSPSMIWKGGVGLVFVALALAVMFVPSFDLGLTSNSRYAFAGLLLLYGLFRLYGCYAEYKSYGDE